MPKNNQNKMGRISITLPKKIIEKIDKARGLTARSTFMADKLKRIRW